jgi:hypothetical protein
VVTREEENTKRLDAQLNSWHFRLIAFDTPEKERRNYPFEERYEEVMENIFPMNPFVVSFYF